MERDFLPAPERSEPENVHQGKYPALFPQCLLCFGVWKLFISDVNAAVWSQLITADHTTDHGNHLSFTRDVNQVYDRDLTTDDFMGSASVTLSDLVMDK